MCCQQVSSSRPPPPPSQVTKRKASVIATQPQLMDLLEQHAGRSTAGNAQDGSPPGGHGEPVPLVPLPPLAPPGSHAPIQQAPPTSAPQLGHSMQGCGTSSALGGLGGGAAGSITSSSNCSSNGVTSSTAGTQAGQVAGSQGQHAAQQQAAAGSPQLVGGQQQCQQQQQQQQCQQHPSNGVHVCAAAGEVECGGAFSILPADLRDLQGVRAAVSRAGLDTRCVWRHAARRGSGAHRELCAPCMLPGRGSGHVGAQPFGRKR